MSAPKLDPQADFQETLREGITTPNAVDPGREIMKHLVEFTIKQLKTQDAEKLTPAFLEFTRKLLNDNAITLAQVRRGDFGEVYKAASENFPFPQPN